jgi:hypothetical protein
MQWLPPEMGGRQIPHPGGEYWPTARFADDPLDRQFSVVLQLPPHTGDNGLACLDARLGILFPDVEDQIRARLLPGSLLLVHEGKRVVALCTVVRVKDRAQAADAVSSA